jgi:translation initiation factor IF-2
MVLFRSGAALKPAGAARRFPIRCLRMNTSQQSCPVLILQGIYSSCGNALPTGMEIKMIEKKNSFKTSKETRHASPEFVVRSEGRAKIELVLKCDTMGSVEAISDLLGNLKIPEAEVKLIQSGVGNIAKQDLLMAMTGSGLVIGFNVGVTPKLEQWVKEHGVEVRLYDVIYRLAEDVKTIAQNLAPVEAEERVTGKCEVIATFKSKKGGVILGCEVVEGTVMVGKHFRVVTAMGPVHSARIESLQIEKRQVKEARAGQQVGVEVSGSSLGKVGDFIECYSEIIPKRTRWSPTGSIIHMGSS